MADNFERFVLRRNEDDNSPVTNGECYVFDSADLTENVLVPFDFIDLNKEYEDVMHGETAIRLVINFVDHGGSGQEEEEHEAARPRPITPATSLVGGDDALEPETLDNNIPISEANKNFWNLPQTKMLIDLYKQNRPLVGKSFKLKTNKKMWEHISDALKCKGYDFSPLQVENRWKTLDQGFKRKTINNKKSGRGRETCSYEKELEEIFVKQANVFPELLLGSKSSITKAELINNFDSCSSETPLASSSKEADSAPDGTNNQHPKPEAEESVVGLNVPTPSRSIQKGKKSLAKQVEHLKESLDSYREKKERVRTERHEKRDQLLKRKNDLLEERNKERKRSNDLMEAYLKHLD